MELVYISLGDSGLGGWVRVAAAGFLAACHMMCTCKPPTSPSLRFAAKAVESAAIRELERRGFPMQSTTDARRRHVAAAAAAGE